MVKGLKKLEILGAKMKKEKLLNELAQLLEVDVDKLSDSYELDTNALDSLVVVSIIAIIDITYAVRIQGSDIEKCNTLKDIFNLIELKQKAI